jgi:hypothetical protein
MKVKIFTVAHVPENLSQAWLQHLRDFDTAHPGCHFEVYLDSPDDSFADVVKMVRIDPELTFTKIFARAKSGDEE